MSGGSLDYASSKTDLIIEDLYYAQEAYLGAKDVESEISELIKDLSRISKNLHSLEWYLSGDIGIESMRSDWCR